MSQQQIQQVLLGIAAAGRSQPRDAISQCEALLDQFPKLVPAWCLAGRFHRVLGDLDKAKNCLDEALSLDPSALPAIAELAQLAIASRRYADAAEYFGKLTELQPGNANHWFNLGMVEERLGRFDSALRALGTALEKSPQKPADIHARMGGLLAMTGREEEAEKAYWQAIELDPELADAHFGLGMMTVAEGRIDDAIGMFRRALERRPGFAPAWQQILEAKRIESDDDADLATVRELLSGPEMAQDDRESLSFAVAKACDDLGQYDEAFSYYQQANSLKRERVTAFDRDELQRSTDGLIDQDLPAAAPLAAQEEATVPVFVIGLPRSGTTLVDQILTAHPQAEGLGENPFFEAALEGHAHDAWTTLDDGAIAGIRERYLALLADVGGSVVSNKYPAHFRLAGLIRRVLPEARFVHVTRNLLDTGLSMYFQDFPLGNHYANDLDDIAAYVTAYQRLMAHWSAGLGEETLLEIGYEALIDDQEGESRRLIAFCGLEWDPACLDFTANQRRVSTLSRWQVRQPLYSSSRNRWQHYQQHIPGLIEALGEPDAEG
jgi:tetratricopeptide (TPR) repeat protein